MGLVNKINELLTREVPPERKGIWRMVFQVTPAGLTGLKVVLAAMVLANITANGGILREAITQVFVTLPARFGQEVSLEHTAAALAIAVLLQDGGKRAMSILQKTLQIVIRPLLNERYDRGREEERQQWEAWLKRQREAGISTWNDDDPPPPPLPPPAR